MIACVSPERTVRSTPRRISFAPSVSSVTDDVQVADLQGGHAFQCSFTAVGSSCRPRSARQQRRVDVDQDVAVLDLDRVDGDRSDGREDGGLPVRRSNREPCSQHSMVQPSTSPSDSETSACEQMSSMAWMPPSSARTTATGWPSMLHRDRADVGHASSAHGGLEAHGRRDLRQLGRRAHRGLELVLDLAQQPLLELGDTDLLDDLGEEAAHDQAPGLVLRDAPRLQVEQLLVVEPAGRRWRGRRRRSRRSRSRGWAPSRRARRR